MDENGFPIIQRKKGLPYPVENEPTNKQLALDVAACAKEILVKYMSLHHQPGGQAHLITKQIADFAFRLAKKTILVDHPILNHRLDPKRPHASFRERDVFPEGRNHDGPYKKWEAEMLTHTDWKPCHQVMRRLQLLPAQSSQGDNYPDDTKTCAYEKNCSDERKACSVEKNDRGKKNCSVIKNAWMTK